MKNKRLSEVVLIAVLTGALAVLLSGCTPESEAAPVAEHQVVTVQRGDITIDISTAGNLSYSLQEDLAFEIAGTVEEVLVEVGDSVEEGQVLAKLDTSEWEDNLAVVEDQVTANERALLQAQINLKNAEIAYDDAVNPYTEEDIEDVKYELRQAESQLRYSLKHGPDSSVLQDQEKVYQLQKTLDEMEEGGDEDDIEIK